MSQIPTRRSDFIQRYQGLEIDLRDTVMLKQLQLAGLSNADICALTAKDGHRLALVGNKQVELANSRQNQQINAEEAFLFFEEKDKNGSWDSVDPENTNNPNQQALVDRIRILGEVFESLRLADTGPHIGHDHHNPDGSIRVPKLADLTFEEATQFFNTHPDQRYERELPPSDYTINSSAASKLWKDTSLQSERDLVTKMIRIGSQWEEVPTHIRADADIRLIAYQNIWQTKQRDLLRFVLPGEWYLGSSHHNPGNRLITREVMQDEEKGLEMLKFSITHIRNYIGVRDNAGKPGFVATDSPRSYANQHKAGHVNPKDYPSLMWRVRFLGDISSAEQRAYINNVRSWTMLIQKITKFPPDYNGNDNLMTNTLDKVVDFGGKILKAILGSKTDRQQLHEQSAQVYCSESGMHLALNLGLNVPLNQAGISGLYGDSLWPKVKALLNEGDTFWKNNKHLDYYGPGGDGYMQNCEQNRLVEMEDAPDWLKPLRERLPGRPLSAGGLVFRPWDSADMIEHFIRIAVPRKGRETWDVSNAQAELLNWTRPGIFHSLGFTPAKPPPPQLVMLFDTIVAKVRRNYDSYEAFRAEIKPELEMAHQIVAPKADGAGAFVPPHMVISINGDEDELIALEPVGQLFHIDTLKLR